MKVCSNHSKNSTSVSGDLELTKMTLHLAAPRGRRHSSGADVLTRLVGCFIFVNSRSPETLVLFLECLAFVFVVNAAGEVELKSSNLPEGDGWTTVDEQE